MGQEKENEQTEDGEVVTPQKIKTQQGTEVEGNF